MIRPEIMSIVRQMLDLGESLPVDVLPLGKRGSDRSFFRLTWPPQQTAILIEYDPKRQENCYHVAIAQFLHSIGVPVPRIFGHDPLRHLALMEDLGDTDLWSLKNADSPAWQELYRKTITEAQRLHSFPEKDFPSAVVQLMAPFDTELYKWERNYFMEHFVGAVCGITLDAKLADELETELSALAERLVAGPRCLVHRDFQSQNVMIRNGNPVFIDFQGMRFGSPFYDLASLLCDPYVVFTDDERDDYLSAYYGLSTWSYDLETFRDYFWCASAQRLMQALGAYGFLSLEKGLTAFLDHIPAGLRNLELAATQAPALPYLRRLLAICRSAWMERENQLAGAGS